MVNELRVAIVGGGPGGLMTARLLEQRLGPGCQLTLLEASHRLGGKIQTRQFASAPVNYEAGVAECYGDDSIGSDALRNLVRDLGLTTTPTGGTAVLLDGVCLRDQHEVRAHHGEQTLRAIEAFQRQAVAAVPLAVWQRGFGPVDNHHPWADRTCAELLDQVADPIARRYLQVGAHSDMATEPHLVNGLVGLRNVLKAAPGSGAQYTIRSGMERLPRRLADCLGRTEVQLNAPVVRVTRHSGASYGLTIRRGRRVEQLDVDAVVMAVPYNALQAIEWTGEQLRRAMTRHVAHYDRPGHYLRVSMLFDRTFWRDVFAGSWVMLDAFGGCCVYDESPPPLDGGFGVLGWLLAGAAALSLCNIDDDGLVTRLLDSLPNSLYESACASFVEGRVHRWAGAVSGQPGGFPLLDPFAAHQPEPIAHPGLVMVGDYLFDSTLNGVLRSAEIASTLVRDTLIAGASFPPLYKSSGAAPPS